MVEIEELKPHEEVVEALVAKLTEEMRRDDIVRDPLIVDQGEYINLEGMHRFSALKRLNCRFAPCCLLDYMSPQITVGSWFRVFSVEEPTLAQDVLSSRMLDYSVSPMDISDITLDPATVVLTKDGERFSLRRS